MKKLAMAMFAAGLLAGCGTMTNDRAVSGAGIGAGIGLLGGPVGVLIGAGVGAAAGAVTEPDDIYLGEPIWRS